MIKNPSELSKEIERSQDNREAGLSTAMVGVGVSAVGASFRAAIETAVGLSDIRFRVGETIGYGAIGIGGIIAVGGLVSAIHWSNRHNTLEATQTELILSGTVPAEAFEPETAQAIQAQPPNK